MQATDNQELVTRDVVVAGGGTVGGHGFLTREGMNPAALLEVGRAQVRRYGVRVLDGRVTSAESVDGGFTVTLEDGASRLLVTTGLVDELPDVPGVRERWGREVLHCPYCHGWEVRDQPIGVPASGPRTVHQALLFRQLTADLMLFVHAAPQPTDKEAEHLAARGVTVVKGEVSSLEVVEDRITGVRMRSGEFVPRQAVVVGPRFAARARMLTGLGLETAIHPSGMGEHVEADATGPTTVPGVWVAGNVTDPTAQVLSSANGGVMAGAAINADRIAEDARGRGREPAASPVVRRGGRSS